MTGEEKGLVMMPNHCLSCVLQIPYPFKWLQGHIPPTPVYPARKCSNVEIPCFSSLACLCPWKFV
jgi:hypothetical protein